MHWLSSDRLRVSLSPVGARLLSVLVDGVDVMAGGATAEDCLAGDWTAGAICGRVAGRISFARFTLDGVEHRLAANMGEHILHGGPDNFALRRWTAEPDEQSVRFKLTSPDGDQGFPGALEATAAYAVRGSTLSLVLEATTSRPTVVNLTNHGYWNLAGSGPALGHEMEIPASRYLPLNDILLPSGEQREVAETRYDFRRMKVVGEAFDNCWVVDGPRGMLRPVLTMRDPVSRRRMEVWASEAGVQMYTANHWNSGMPGRKGPLQQHGSIAVEPQNFPDAMNHDGFPSAVLRPGETYRNHIEWRFS